MKVIAGYELRSGKELCIGVWDTPQDAAKDLGISAECVRKRIAWAKENIPFIRGRGGTMPGYYLTKVEIDESEETGDNSEISV